MKHLYITFFTLLIISCTPSKKQVDLIVINANVYTVDDAFSTAEAFAVKDGKFVFVGANEEVQKLYEAKDKIDAKGKAIVPGLIDAHCHFYRLGENQQAVDLVATTSFTEVLDRVQDFQLKNKKEFIYGRGWDQNDWEIKEFPTKKEVDELYPDTPVAIERIDGHAYLVNQKALDLAGITKETVAVGGEIVKIDGELTGVLVDGPMGMIDAIIPKPSQKTMIAALKDAERISIANGLTTVNDAGLSREIIELIDSLQQVGEMKIRVYAMVANYPENLEYYLNKGILKTDRLNVRSVKVYGDGALGSRGAVMRTPYSDKANHFGAMVTPVDEIERLAYRIADTDYQMNTHAIGDSANIVVLRAYKNALKGKKDRRWKVEHAQIVSAPDFEYFEDGIIPSVQPTHATSDMYWAEDRVGAERMHGAYAFKTLLNKAGMVALGTDFPVEQVSPFLTFYAAVARKDFKGYPDGGFQINEALTREEALKGMTIWAAYSNFEEDEKGSIEIGKMADFVILDKDIMTIPEEETAKVIPQEVYISGEKMN
ncbi:Amidohydrolase 3 [Cellulophaga algicola DSM 14237]|uniref:Amidohydrolase 3 n=1 Tax=Cellulophaga algicola (strain DSM 14237 / IC166 / ACAM 630) TaxID=688270 RepID=E6XBM2_CELAD|nr:amidohydrolase [Cellulophaga algicola]ADV47857.1 Amidohydrolase 3 [Cellulophaga algicola DSM 14237]